MKKIIDIIKKLASVPNITEVIIVPVVAICIIAFSFEIGLALVITTVLYISVTANKTIKEKETIFLNDVRERGELYKHIEGIPVYVLPRVALFNYGGAAAGAGVIAVNEDTKDNDGVVLHEVSHVIHNDGNNVAISKYVEMIMLLVLLLTCVTLLGGVYGYITATVLHPIITYLINGYSKQLEYRADKYAADNGGRESLLALLTKNRESEAQQNFILSSILKVNSSHPSTDKRIARLLK